MICERTPEARFDALPEYRFEPHYLEIDGIRMHYLDEGPRDVAPIVLLHGQPSWSFLWRHVIPLLAERGHRVIAPDLIGFGKSDKPLERESFSYLGHVDWLRSFFNQLSLEDVTLVAHDWGGSLGLVIVGQEPSRFSRVVATNTALVAGEIPLPPGFLDFKQKVKDLHPLPLIDVMESLSSRAFSVSARAGYEAPFPDEKYMAAIRAFPTLVPTSTDDVAAPAIREAQKSLGSFEKPFLTLFGALDPIYKGGQELIKMAVPGSRGRPHVVLEEAGHYIQEDAPGPFSEALLRLVDAK